MKYRNITFLQYVIYFFEKLETKRKGNEKIKPTKINMTFSSQ